MLFIEEELTYIDPMGTGLVLKMGDRSSLQNLVT